MGREIEKKGIQKHSTGILRKKYQMKEREVVPNGKSKRKRSDGKVLTAGKETKNGVKAGT